MDSGLEMLNALFARMHAHARGRPAPDLAARRAALAVLRGLVTDNLDAFAAAISEDFGLRARDETVLMEGVPVVTAIAHTRKHLGRWMRDSRRPVDMSFQPARAWVRHEPLGVVGVIAPWNYPLQLTLSPAVDALAAGNCVLIKPSELTPAFSDLLARLVAERFDPAELAVAKGGVDVSRAFAGLPFDHLVFTGSTRVGREIMREASANLTPVTLELGGKSPAIVAPGFPIEKAARSVAFGKFLNAGQTCVAPDYALVPESDARAFAEAVLARAVHAYPVIDGNGDYTNIVAEQHCNRLRAMVAEAEQAGAIVLRHPGHGDWPRRMAPTVVLNAPDHCRLMQEEIFGPVLPVRGYATLDDALAHVRAGDRPLALYAFAADGATERAILNGATSGGVTINGTLLHLAQHDLPFGGVGSSGMGGYHGRDGFLRFSHARAVHKVGPMNLFERLGPPWGDMARFTARTLLKR